MPEFDEKHLGKKKDFDAETKKISEDLLKTLSKTFKINSKSVASKKSEREQQSVRITGGKSRKSRKSKQRRNRTYRKK